MTSQPQIHYTVDPSTHPSTWPSHEPGVHTVVHKVDVIYVNVNAASTFSILRTGTNGSIHEVVTQVAKHIARNHYRLVSFNATEYSCVVVLSTDKPEEEVLWKNGFPWDIEEEQQPDVVL
ncbi:hypothetical protein PT974_03083 [Cladobotryum mycophilum]|uniref:Tautomerase cis-CaaD-like domain-containing protein n=1 Tax=Cladobotryum mycophilum TaxID=491253 RepID=A0ABR0SVZ0_9HYPO